MVSDSLVTFKLLIVCCLLPLSVFFSLCLSSLSLGCILIFLLSQVLCRQKTLRKPTRGSTSVWRLMWKASDTLPLPTCMCEVGSNLAVEPIENKQLEPHDWSHDLLYINEQILYTKAHISVTKYAHFQYLMDSFQSSL